MTNWTVDSKEAKAKLVVPVRLTQAGSRATGSLGANRHVAHLLRHSRQENRQVTRQKVLRYSIAGFIETRSLFNLAPQKHSGGLIHA